MRNEYLIGVFQLKCEISLGYLHLKGLRPAFLYHTYGSISNIEHVTCTVIHKSRNQSVIFFPLGARFCFKMGWEGWMVKKRNLHSAYLQRKIPRTTCTSGV